MGICKHILADLVQVAEHKLKDMKARGIILDGAKDHVISHITMCETTHKLWVALTSLYQSTTENRKMVLIEKLNNIHMNRLETVTSYLTWIH